jgi:glycosyltransferase involved in cell wall biosynthesis
MNLAVFAHSLGRGGAQLWLAELLRRAGAGTDFGCTVVAPGDGPLRGELEARGVEVHVTTEGWWGDRRVYEGRVTELALFLAARGHDAVLANTVRSLAGADAAVAAGIPVLWAVHEGWPPRELWARLFEPGEVGDGVKRRLEEVLGDVNAVTFVARTTQALYGHLVGPGRSLVVPYGVDLAAVDAERSRLSRDDARAALGVPAEARLILVMGATEPRRAQTVVTAAFAEAAAGDPRARLALVGAIESRYTDALRDYVDALGLRDRVLVVPLAEDTGAWYRAADALVSASDLESLPRTLIEAMSFGVPCAATAVGGVPELVADGHNGWLFPPLDRAALAGVLRRIVSASAEELAEVGRRGRATAEAGLDSAGYAADVLALLEGLRSDPQALPGDLLARAGRPERRLLPPGA